jgi:hypothetical protein
MSASMRKILFSGNVSHPSHPFILVLFVVLSITELMSDIRALSYIVSEID